MVHLVEDPGRGRYVESLHTNAGKAPFADLSEEERLLVNWHLGRIGAARENVIDMFSYVMREEFSRQPIRVLPFQRVLFKFLRTYPHCVVRLPVGYGKTYSLTAQTLFRLGRDPTTRAVFISAAEEQAAKPLAAIRSYIEESPELRLVFPRLKRTEREGEPWTRTAIVVDRPMGIRDASVMALGLDSERLPGARLSDAVVDDILNEQNTATQQQREKTLKWLKSTALTRMDKRASRFYLLNTPWHPEDATYAFEDIGWPSLSMDCFGGIFFKNAPHFDCEELRPSYRGGDYGECRLAAHDNKIYVHIAKHELALEERVRQGEFRNAEGWLELPSAPPVQDDAPDFDEDEIVPLWPEKVGRAELARIESTLGGGPEWNRAYRLRTRDDSTARVQIEWIDKAKANARALGYVGPQSQWDGIAFTGIDLATGRKGARKKKSDKSAIFSFAVLPGFKRLILRVDVGKFKGRETIDLAALHCRLFNSIARVETNAAQIFLKQWALELDVSLPLRSHETTAKNKRDPVFGVESIFTELENGAWLVPCDSRGRCDPGIQQWIDDLLSYDPNSHTGDALMASWMAREQGRATGLLGRGAEFWGRSGSAGIAAVSAR